jgi:uncharacterized protein with HEPN domain
VSRSPREYIRHILE